jgi:uncharacterized membrane protein
VNRRRAIAVLALLGGLDSVYLLLAKTGLIGGLSCTVSHGCDTVNSSSYSEFLGIPVAGIGLVGYLVLFVLAIVGIQPRWLDDSLPDRLVSLFAGVGVVFTLYLTYAEIFILGAICQWCVVSQVLILGIFVLSLIGVLRGQDEVTGRSGVQALPD